MPKLANRQPALKPQDLLVLLALQSRGDGDVTYPQLAEQTGLAVSAVHASLKRAAAARLLMFQARRPVLLKMQLREFLLTGAKYAFPPLFGSMSRGVPTGYAAPPLSTIIAPSADPVPVWPSAKGSVRGLSLVPLYPTVPEVALRDEKLYAMLSLFDAIRAGPGLGRRLARSPARGHACTRGESRCALRDDGMSYGDYVEQLTYLLFLKMADERSRPPYHQPSPIPTAYAWPALLAKDDDALFVPYCHTLEELGRQPGTLALIFGKARTASCPGGIGA